MIRKLQIKLRSFYVRYIRNERCKQELSGAALWEIYSKEMIKMQISMIRRGKI